MLTETNILQGAGVLLNEGLRKAFREQGHTLTGGWERSINATVSGNHIIGEANYYGGILDSGVTPGRIPFGGARSGPAGGKSKYIQALYLYWKQRGLPDKQAMSAAFATAHKQKTEGMPTAASNRFSSTGKRVRFISVVEKEVMPDVDKQVQKGLDQLINERLKEPKTKVY